MGYDDNPYLDEDGEPLMDPDAGSDPDQSPPAAARYDDEGLEDEDVEWGWGRSPSPSPARSRKRTLMKGGRSEGEAAAPLGGEGLEDWEDEQPSSSSAAAKRPKALSKSAFREGGKGGGKEVEKKKKKKQKVDQEKLGRGARGSIGSSSRDQDQDGESEIQELWDTIAGGDSEDDREGIRTADDDAFIDDSGVDPADRFGSDNEGGRFGYDAPQAEEGEEDEEINQMFKGGKKKKKNEKSPAEIALIVEHLMAELEVTAEEDAELNRQSKPAINKLKKLPLLTEVLSKKSLQQEFLDHGVLTLLKNWLEPLPDGSLPNMNVRTAILKILTDFPIDLEQNDRREQLKKSGLGKVIMFLSKSDEETTANRKLAKDLVDKWSRPIFNKSTRFEDMRSFDDDRVPYRRPIVKKPASKASDLESRDDELDEFSQGPKSGQSVSRQHASIPEAAPLDFVVRPRSKIDPDEIRARAKQQVQDQRRIKHLLNERIWLSKSGEGLLEMNKRLQQLKATKKKQLQAAKVSAEGRNMIKYL